ncbi:MAG: F0F1 ATP synthase subunit epsilon [Planctomycetota bacterium]
MNLKVLLPTRILVDEPVAKVVAHAWNGAFCLLPHHVDFTTALAPGLLSLLTPDGREEFLAVDEGILVKSGAEVLVSVRQALRGAELGALHNMVETEFRVVDEREKGVRTAASKLEAELVRRFAQLQELR